ncbi:MAG: prolyl oligopeptidase family serine peptidase [Pyrinomonadaceae bacterium]
MGWARTSDYGSPDSAQDFKALYAYSPLHNLKPGTAYPPTLITTADHDDRVVPAHSFKFAAALPGSAGRSSALRSSALKPKRVTAPASQPQKLIDEWADKWGFLLRVLEMNGPIGGQKQVNKSEEEDRG